jgi:hypothetical protein
MKVDFSKNIGILKKNKIEALEMKSSLCHCWWKCKPVKPIWESVWRFLKT